MKPFLFLLLLLVAPGGGRLSIDPRTGDVWGAYGSSPARSQHVFRIRSR